jgi:hypothetical protein
MNHILFPINHGMLRFTGFDVLHPFIAWSPTHLSDNIRRDYLNRLRPGALGSLGNRSDSISTPFGL